MNEPMIVVERLTKTYRIPVRPEGLRAALRSLARRDYRDVEAVREARFAVAPGEMMALLGPNGAGKTTLLKTLSGLLHPTAGSARVAGYTPWERRHDFLRQISMVMGNKSQMLWDIPPADTFRMLREVYRLPEAQFRQTRDELVDLLGVGALLDQPVRNLSLGERMKCELAAALLHRPRVLFLDEPTLGLDVSAQRRLRGFVREYNQRYSVTVILTSHYMADVTALCSRVVLIHQGRLLYDGQLDALAQRLAPFKRVRLSLDEAALPPDAPLELPPGAELLERDNGQLTLRLARDEAAATTGQLLRALPVVDLTVEDPPIEDVMDRIYQQGAPA